MKHWTKIILGALVLTAVFVWTSIARSPSASESKNSASIYFLDVGQGDAQLIEKGDYQILIDGGPDDRILSELPKAMPLTDRTIEVVILTHPHADHLVGLNQVLDRYQVKKIFYNGMQYDSNAYKEFTAKIKEKNVESIIPNIGEKVEPFQNGEITFLWPGKQYEQKTNENANNTSLVARFCYFSYCTLFTGDIETDAQSQMLVNCHPEQSEGSQHYTGSFVNAQDDRCKSELLKLSHHGSSNGTNQILLNAINPAMAVIEVGAHNKFGHPNASVLDLLQKNNIQYYRTDINGTLKFVVTGAGILKK